MAEVLRALTLNSPDETDHLAKEIAPHLGAGDVILLQGGLGAGKTHFARALIQTRLAANGMSEDVPSPTYTLVQTYSDGALEIWHADLYRLSSSDEIDELGLTDAFETGICLVEWPDRLASLAPRSALTIRFRNAESEDARIVEFFASDPRWIELVSNLP